MQILACLPCALLTATIPGAAPDSLDMHATTWTTDMDMYAALNNVTSTLVL
jgi:hypothetical protein